MTVAHKRVGRRKEAARPAPGPAKGLVAGPVQELRVARHRKALVLTLARPERRNSLCEAMLIALKEAIEGAGSERDVRAIVIAAEGSVFCAGHDLDELTRSRAKPDKGAAVFARIMRRCSAMMRAIVDCPKPVIAAVEGAALAAGCQLVATCDLAVASERASFCTPGVNIGLFCSTPMVALARNVARKRAMEMLLLGEMLPANAALEWGLVNRVVPAGEAVAAALGLAHKIASKPQTTIAIGKRAFYRQIEMGLGEAYDYAATGMVEKMLHREAAEGIGAFLEKRAPNWDRS